MATRGRPPKPTRLKVLTGNPGKRPLNDSEPQPDPTPPRCPSWLSRQAKAQWKKLAPELTRLGLLTSVDEGALAGYCSALAELRHAEQTLQREGRYLVVGGFFVETPGAPPGEDGKPAGEWRGGSVHPHPAMARQAAAWQAVRQFSALFGLDPSSRSRLSVKGAAGAKAGGLKAFLGRKQEA